ncbi:hypothetical protein DXV75_15970 [Alteromonas aestuariivivens]|uniref:SsuA/THI5-like domain-containing protein n=1 Tax=Alteromonas aestuariivivens TaxID=1938339 RepID=A0A3D8M389_9ALTE|nr:PhnD/SsuA/transferrin family substrate-binding protein [Alteromonas aestuariivivens]RDV24060.1 hypothetical protein DXV75_15970 [Alteromonas aestuariivivens]
MHRVKPSLLLIVVLLMALFVGIGFGKTYVPLTEIPPMTDKVLSCPKPLSANADVFDVYLTESSVAEMALERLCADPVVQRQYGDVNVFVGHNDYDTFRHINHGISDFALVKGNVMAAFAADKSYGYEVIASYPDYSAYFISMKEKPLLSKEYLLGKRIGLLDYTSSRSGHILPKTVLKSLGLNESNTTLKYYNSHQELRRALLAGEVDIISSYWGKGDEARLSANYITTLAESVSGMRWYLKMDTRNTDLRCAAQSVVKSISNHHPRNYYQHVELQPGCSSHD